MEADGTKAPEVYTCRCGSMTWLIDAPMLECWKCGARYFLTEQLIPASEFNAAWVKHSQGCAPPKCPVKPDPEETSSTENTSDD